MKAKSPLGEFLSLFTQPNVVASIASEVGWSVEDAGAQLDTWVAEVPRTWAIIEPHLRGRSRVLEIGSGLGLLSHWLAATGHDVVALEPEGRPQGFFYSTRKAIRAAVAGAALSVPRALDMEAEDLPSSGEGPFDFIFSIHVLEHVADLDSVFEGMVGLLAPGGRMVHLTPNYAVPYDPHFRVPVLHRYPGLTARLFGGRLRGREALWDGLEFITHDRVLELAQANDCVAVFDRSILQETVLRLSEDPTFAARHGGFISALAGRVRHSRAFALLPRVPTRFASPMCFVVEKRDAAA